MERILRSDMANLWEEIGAIQPKPIMTFGFKGVSGSDTKESVKTAVPYIAEKELFELREQRNKKAEKQLAEDWKKLLPNLPEGKTEVNVENIPKIKGSYGFRPEQYPVWEIVTVGENAPQGTKNHELIHAIQSYFPKDDRGAFNQLDTAYLTNRLLMPPGYHLMKKDTIWDKMLKIGEKNSNIDVTKADGEKRVYKYSYVDQPHELEAFGFEGKLDPFYNYTGEQIDSIANQKLPVSWIAQNPGVANELDALYQQGNMPAYKDLLAVHKDALQASADLLNGYAVAKGIQRNRNLPADVGYYDRYLINKPLANIRTLFRYLDGQLRYPSEGVAGK